MEIEVPERAEYIRVILCELNSKSKHVLQCEKEEDELPTMRQLYTIIEELALKCNKMEKMEFLQI